MTAGSVRRRVSTDSYAGQLTPVSKAPIQAMRMTKTDLIFTKDAAAILGVSERSVRRWVASGKMPQRVPEGREKKFRKEDIEAEIKLDAIELVALSEASEILDRSVRTLRRWIASGKMPVRIKRGRELKFRYADVLWLKELL
jgi:excisionase family DNA binding protein